MREARTGFYRLIRSIASHGMLDDSRSSNDFWNNITKGLEARNMCRYASRSGMIVVVQGAILDALGAYRTRQLRLCICY
jgi:hypothetical protein